MTNVTIETRPGALAGRDSQRYICDIRMQWVERFGKQLALALLAFMWPVIDVLQKSLLPASYVAMFALIAVAYAVVYSAYCQWGNRAQNNAVHVGAVLLLTLLGLALQHLDGTPDFNFVLIPLVIAGFALPPRLALITGAFVAAASAVDAALLDSSPPGRVALQLALVLPPVLLFGGGAMALRYLLLPSSDSAAWSSGEAQPPGVKHPPHKAGPGAGQGELRARRGPQKVTLISDVAGIEGGSSTASPTGWAQEYRGGRGLAHGLQAHPNGTV